MSHYPVAVFSKKPEDIGSLLSPFYEAVDGNSPYAVFQEDPQADEDNGMGRRGYWRNPHAKWDWWNMGGRWRGQLKLKEGKEGAYGSPPFMNENHPLDPKRCDQALVADCDFTPDPEAYAHALRQWEIQVEDAALRDGEKALDHMRIYKPEYYIRQYGDKEYYAKRQSMFNPFAFLTAEGEWHEPGRMGWFGMDDSTVKTQKEHEEKFRGYLKQAGEQGLYITVVDCHI